MLIIFRFKNCKNIIKIIIGGRVMAYQKPMLKFFEFETKVANMSSKNAGCEPSSCERVKVKCLMPYYNG